jgi:glyoxylase-like metal-dependent hydrolase (beta-lactamase superfamily II)
LLHYNKQKQTIGYIMKNKLSILLLSVMIYHCAQSTRPFTKVSQGTSQNIDHMLNQVKAKGPIKFAKVNAADWAVDREGLIDFNDQKAKDAGLQEGKEPIQIYFYILEHPKFGKFLIDSGISREFRKDRSDWPVSKLVQSAMNLDALKINKTLEEFLSENKLSVNGVFLTHMHLDHILGIPDLPGIIPVYVGPNESSHKAFVNMFVQGSTDKLFGENVKIEHLNFESDAPEKMQILDFFGDGSLYIMWVSGHTPGSLAFLVQTTTGPELVVGDTCHTAWGWENNVPPGGFTSNGKLNREKLNSLKELSTKIPKIKIHPGHQSIK